MRYRAEVDGLRAIAVVPVVFFHAGFWPFSGGFAGVDVFFVISGYLITTILTQELERDRYSIVRFYERRARRILPALFVVMGVSAVFAYMWMLPDELKRFGQSLVATTLFSNNILLAITSGYWEIDSEFKPLLHTWSLGVEEQYYIVFPIYLYFGWRYFRKALVPSLVVFGLISLIVACWGTYRFPDMSFYLLPTRSWELLIGALAAFVLDAREGRPMTGGHAQLLSLLGLILIVGAEVAFDNNTPTPSVYTLLPTCGAALVILYANEKTLANRLLSLKPIVGIGLISYSIYLWHNPLFVFARIYSVEPPDATVISGLIVLTFVLSYLRWRYVEMPFRSLGMISRQSIFVGAFGVSALAIAVGVHFHVSHGIPGRMYAASAIQYDDMYKTYNQSAFAYKKDAFYEPGKLYLLVLGNSFGRDFVNMVRETLDVSRVEIVYRDDVPDCFSRDERAISQRLLSQADVIVLSKDVFEPACVSSNVGYAEEHHKAFFYIGTKHFGANLNWLIRMPASQRANRDNRIPPAPEALEKLMASTIPAKHFISLMAQVRKGDMMPFTDEKGRLLSPDRVHFTKQGAIYFGQRVLKSNTFGRYLKEKGYPSLAFH